MYKLVIITEAHHTCLCVAQTRTHRPHNEMNGSTRHSKSHDVTPHLTHIADAMHMNHHWHPSVYCNYAL